MSRADDAFSWEGDDDPTLEQGRDDDAPAARGGRAALTEGTETGQTPPAAPTAEPEGASPEGASGAEPGDAARGGGSAGGPVPSDGGEAAGEEDAGDEPRRFGDVALVALGVIGGVYALWTAGWVFGALRLRSPQGDDPMFLASMVLAIVAPAVWFLASWALTVRRATWVRFLALLAGVVVLVPWPFMMVGASGQ